MSYELYFRRLEKIYRAAKGRVDKKVRIAEALQDGYLSEDQIHDTVDYMGDAGERWIKHDDEAIEVWLTHTGKRVIEDRTSGQVVSPAPPQGRPNEAMPPTLEEWAGTQHPTLAIVFTDVIGSTELANSKGDPKWIEMILEHFRRGRDLISKHGGREIKLIGDSFMAVFRNAIAAFDFALELHHDTGHSEIRIRAGIHVGNVRVIDNDIFGIAVNYTKRVESNAGKFIALSDVAHGQIANEKADRHDFRMRPVMEELSGFADKQRIWKVFKKLPPGLIRELPPPPF